MSCWSTGHLIGSTEPKWCHSSVCSSGQCLVWRAYVTDCVPSKDFLVVKINRVAQALKCATNNVSSLLNSQHGYMYILYNQTSKKKNVVDSVCTLVVKSFPLLVLFHVMFSCGVPIVFFFFSQSYFKIPYLNWTCVNPMIPHPSVFVLTCTIYVFPVRTVLP